MTRRDEHGRAIYNRANYVRKPGGETWRRACLKCREIKTMAKWQFICNQCHEINEKLEGGIDA